MGSGSTCDGQYLFSQDVLGYTKGHMPRHARIYRDFSKEFDRLHNERVAAYKEYIKDVEEKKFDDPKITVSIEDREFENFLNLVEKI
jgi:3-methyl-2-oxobutanoate hydroxymethyltransferase